MSENAIRIVTGILLIGFLLVLANPSFDTSDRSPAFLLVLLIATLLATAWAAFVTQEQSGIGAAKEMRPRLRASRTAYVAGVAILTVALLFQGMTHKLDPWLALVLATMVGTKLAARSYYETS